MKKKILISYVSYSNTSKSVAYNIYDKLDKNKYIVSLIDLSEYGSKINMFSNFLFKNNLELLSIRLPIFPPEAPTVRQGRSASQTLLELPALLDLLFASSSTGRAHSRSHHQPLAVWPGPENTYSSKTKEKHHALHGVLLWYPAATYFPGPSPAKYLRRIRA